MDTTILWGPEAVQALRAPRASPSLRDEDKFLPHLRCAVGQYASEGQLRHHLRGAHGKLHWAVNGYLREAVLARSGPEPGGADYEPRPRAAGGAVAAAAPPAEPGSSSREASSGAVVLVAPKPVTAQGLSAEADGEPPALALPLALWELILRDARLSAEDLRSASQVCTTLRAAAQAEPVWERLFLERWGPVPGAPAEGSTWRAAFRARGALMGAMRCPVCAAPRLAPVVYGFPSQALVRAQRSGHVVLGGDYLVASDPIWVCLGFCGTQWRTWPWDRSPQVCDPGMGSGLLQRLGLAAMGRAGGPGGGFAAHRAGGGGAESADEEESADEADPLAAVGDSAGDATGGDAAAPGADGALTGGATDDLFSAAEEGAAAEQGLQAGSAAGGGVWWGDNVD